MAEKSSIGTFSVGLNTEDDPMMLKEGEYTFMYGGTLNSADSKNPFMENIEAFIPEGVLPIGYIITGRCNLNSNETLVMLAATTGGSEIGSYQYGKYTPKVNYAGLNFKVNFQIKVAYKVTPRGDRIIYWTDDNDHPRWMNYDAPNYVKVLGSDGCLTDDLTRLDVDAMQIFKNYFNPCVTVVDTPETGGIPACGLFVTTQYADALGNGLTAWVNPVGPVPIFHDTLSKSFPYIGGDKSEVLTNKALRISLSEADTSFSHLNVTIIKVTGGVKAAFKVATIPVGTQSYTYTGIGNTDLSIPLDEVIQPAVVYNRAKTIEATDKELTLGNVWRAHEFNFQPYVSKLQVQWQLFKGWSDDKVMSFKNPSFAAYMRVFRQDEVYALALELDLIDGTTTRSYHVPGRTIDHKADGSLITNITDSFGISVPSGHWDSSKPVSSADVLETSNPSRWQVYNTAFITGSLSPGTEDGIAEYGEMAYYESIRLYPCDEEVWGVDAGKPIRFHKMPDSTVFHIHDGLGAHRAYDQRVMLNYLGLRLPNIEVVIASLPVDVKSMIKGWRIVVGDRTYSKSIIASGILFNARRQNWKYDPADPDDNRLYPNYPLNDLRPDPYVYAANKVIGVPFSNNIPLSGLPNPLFTTPDSWHTDYLKDSFFFHSPDTHFRKAYLAATELKVNAELYGKVASQYNWVDPYPEFLEKGSDTDRAALQGTSIATYNNYLGPVSGRFRRRLKDALYIPFNSKVSGGAAKLPVWNVYRESSVLVTTEKPISDPTVTDTSRFVLIDEPTGNLTSSQQFGCNMLKKVSRDASAYYVTLKRSIEDQYGSIEEIRYLDTYRCGPSWLPADIIFGGDTFLGTFSLKTQNIMYQNMKEFIGADNGLSGADFKPAETVAHSIYYYRNRSTGGKPRDQSVMLCKDSVGAGIFGIFGDGDATALGYLVMAMYGVPNFWGECDHNMELRYPGDLSSQSFYPNLNDGSYRVEDWLSVKNIDFDNVFNINMDYNAKNEFKVHDTNDPLYNPLDPRDTHYSTRIIYSLESQPEDIYDNWLVFKALNYYDLPKNRGELLDINYLGNYKTMFRTESSVFMDTLYSTLATTEGQVQLGSGKLLSRAPQEVAYTSNGYGGSGSRWCFDDTPFGAFFAAPGFGIVFNMSDKLGEISANKMTDWFDRNLRFILPQQVSGISTDNPANPQGIGVLSAYDSRRKLWILTKRDYEVLDAANVPLMSYSDGTMKLGGNTIDLGDSSLFINRSWTMLYNPKGERWISWEPFIPNYYLSSKDSLCSFVADDNNIWRHNQHSNSMQTFYGKYAPFIAEMVNKVDGVNQFINPALTFLTSAVNINKGLLTRTTFNKVIVYNDRQCSGILNLIMQDENNLASLYSTLLGHADSRDIAVRLRKGMFNFSDYCDIYTHGDMPFFTTEGAFPLDKVLDHNTLNYATPFFQEALFRGSYLKTRFILDNSSDVKLLVKLVVSAATVPSF